MNSLRPLMVAALILLIGCSEEAPPPVVTEVIVEQPRLVPYKPSASYVGRIQARDDVKIQAKVTGYLKEWNFKEGDLVKKGDQLYQIDPAQFEAELAKAKAELSSAEAAVTVAGRNFTRGKELLPKGAISASEMDKIEANKLTADAELEGAKANLQAAEVNLGYTRILAPIDGRIGSSKFSPGDLIGPESGALTSLVSINPIQALFQVSEQVFLGYQARADEYKARGEVAPKLEVKLEMADKSMYPETGHVDYISNRIDQNTGTIEARAEIPNHNGELRPGQFVRVVLVTTFEIDTLMVSQSALQSDQQGDFVFVVGPDNKIARRNVVVGDRVGTDVVVSSGLQEEDSVVVQGIQKVRAGQLVKTRTTNESGEIDKATEE